MRGRGSEQERIEQLLREVRAGQSRALVVSGEAGVGKSALLEHVAERATGCRVARAAGVQAEAELAFATLHQLCSPLLDHLGAIPAPQSEALSMAFGLRHGPAPDRFLLGLSVLSLLAEAAAERPLVCIVDDAQWLDHASAQVLGFVARRLAAESVALVFARRGVDPGPSLAGIPVMVLGGLSPSDAQALLDSVVHGPLDQQVRDRIVAETQGNPLAILELPRGLTRAELAAGLGVDQPGGLTARIEDSFRRQLGQLSPDQRRLALVAAAEPLGDAALLWRAADRLGISVDDADPAVLEDLLRWTTARVTFRHPLVRSAVYWSATVAERRVAHGALAAVTDPVVDGDRWAWHLAQATAGPDEEVAGELERSATRAQARGGYAAAAAFLDRATALTPDPGVRAARALAAAEAHDLAGNPDEALRLLAATQTAALTEAQAARVDLLRAEIAHARNRGGDAPPLLLRAARRLEPFDVSSARDTYLQALAAAQFAGPAVAEGIAGVAQAARHAPPPAGLPRAQDLLLDGMALLATEGYQAGVSLLTLALEMFRGAISDEDALRWNWLACRVASLLWDYDTWTELADRTVRLARQTGALRALPVGLAFQLAPRVFAGELDAVASLSEEMDAAADATGVIHIPYGSVLRAAFRGRETEAMAVIESSIEASRSRGEGLAVTAAHTAQAVLYNGLGRHDLALAAAEQGTTSAEALAWYNWALVELVEAAARCRQLERALDGVERLAERTRASGTDWALGVEARSRALVSEGHDAERHHREAISRLRRTRVRVDLARAHLLYGEWLRRERRRLDARQELRLAFDMFSTMGIEAFAERARFELEATGEVARKRTVDAGTQLTKREAQIARLARDGLSNPEIGTRLFLSPRTVEYHLHKVFSKFGIMSRTELARVLEHAPSAS